MLTGWVVCASLFWIPCPTQDPATERIKREAAGQAGEADRLFKSGDFASALPLYRAEQKSRALLGDARYEAYAYRGMACCLGPLGEMNEALAALEAALKIDLKLDDIGLAGYDSLLMARALGQIGEDDKAVKRARFALERFTKGEDRDHEAEARLLLVRSMMNLGKVDEARAELAKAEAITRDLKLPALTGEMRAARGRLAWLSGKRADALADLVEAESILKQNPTAKLESARMGLEIGTLLVEMDRLKEAEPRMSEAAVKLAELRDPQGSAEALLSLAGIQISLKKPQLAIESARKGGLIFAEIGSGVGQIEARIAEANALDLLDQRAEAYDLVVKAVKQAERAYQDQPEERIRLHLLASELAARLKRTADVQSHRKQARSLVELIDDELLRDAYKKQLEKQ